MEQFQMPSSRQSPGERQPAVDWLTSHTWPDLLPTAWLTDAEFEDFVEELLKAQPLLGSEVRHVADVARWGVPGDKQYGIDFFGHFNDGTPAAWQCKQLERLRPFEVKDAVEAVTFDGAEELYLVYGRVAKRAARDEIREHPGWQLLDRRDLTAMLRLLPSHAQRDIIDRTWGPDVRRMFVEAPGDSFVSLATLKNARLNPSAVMNDLGPLAGREPELETLAGVLDPTSDTHHQVVIVVGPGGRGKSRLVTEALTAHAMTMPGVPIVCLAPGHTFSVTMLRELRRGPCVVFIDDAHADPAALAPLLGLAREVPEMQLVLATRPSALSGVEEQVSLALFWTDERVTVRVEELPLPKARALVKGLTEGLHLTFELRSYLADQAVHSAHVAVITTGLIRRNKLTSALAVDEHLRKLVLARYQELLLPGDIDGVDVSITQRVLATYATIGPVPTADEDLKARIAQFCDLDVIVLARLVRALRDRGILVEQRDHLRVVPDVLADQVTELTAAVEGHDTGFVTSLWDSFGTSHHHRLALSLGELDWRLTHDGGPSVMEPVWEAIRERLRSPYFARLGDELAQLEQLATTQPVHLVAALEELRGRLEREDRDNVPVIEDPDEQPYLKLFKRPPRGRSYVRERMPVLYSRAAVNDPDLLEVVLDALWALRKRDGRVPHSHPDHAERLVTDHLANLAKLPHRSFPERIVARATVWLETPDEDEIVTTPLFVLKPLLAKEVLETIQSGLHQLSFQPHIINAPAMREVRDQIRALLLQQAQSTTLRRAGEALDLLSEALHPPHGYFDQRIGIDAIVQWESDDLATIAILAQIAEGTTSAVIRRVVRDVVSWSAEHSTSLRVQHAALTLAVHLDAIDDLEDQLAELVLSGDYGRSLERFENVATLDELQAERGAEHERTKDFTEEQADQDRMAHISQKIKAREQLVAARNEELTRRLIDVGNTTEMLKLLDNTTRAVQQVRKDKHISLWGIWNQIDAQAPHLLGPLAAAIAANRPGPLDNEIDSVVYRWLGHQPRDAAAWIADATTSGRKAMKHGVAAGFARFGWHERGEEFGAIWAGGLTDEDPDVVQAFLAGAGTYLRLHPIEASQTLLDHDINPAGASRVLDDACHYDGRAYGIQLDPEQATAVLNLVTRARLSSHAAQEIVTGIATTHPTLVLDYLAERADDPERLPNDTHGLRTAYDTHADALATWVRDSITRGFSKTGQVLRAAVNEHLTPAQATSLGGVCAGLDGPQLLELAGILSFLDQWALEHRHLAEALMMRARETGVTDDVREGVLHGGMSPTSWGYTNGISDDLSAAHQRAKEAAENTTDELLRDDYVDARDRLKNEIDTLAREHTQEKEVEGGW
jgi:hypothetical protein